MQGEVKRRSTVATTRRHGDDQLMHQARDEKDHHHRRLRTEAPGRGLEQQVMREIAKRMIPALAPELGDRGSEQRCLHQRLHIPSSAAPEGRQQGEHTAVQRPDEADHAQPGGSDAMGNVPCDQPSQGSAKDEVGHAANDQCRRAARLMDCGCEAAAFAEARDLGEPWINMGPSLRRKRWLRSCLATQPQSKSVEPNEGLPVHTGPEQHKGDLVRQGSAVAVA